VLLICHLKVLLGEDFVVMRVEEDGLEILPGHEAGPIVEILEGVVDNFGDVSGIANVTVAIVVEF
jgi:hypothetical protein